MKLSVKTALYYVGLLFLFYSGVIAIELYTIRQTFFTNLMEENHQAACIISHALQQNANDSSKIRFVIDKLFESGEYGLLQIKEYKTKKIIYSRAIDIKCDGIPKWLLSTLLSTSVLKKEIETVNGRHIQISVQKCICSITKMIYKELISTALLFLFFAAAGYLLFYAAIQKALGSLDSITEQAEEIQKNRFVINGEAPSSPEFAQVISTMNSLSKRVKELYEKSSETLREYHEILYRDGVTALYNRRYFIKTFKETLTGAQSSGYGSLMMIRLSGLNEANSRIGRSKVDDLLLEFAKRIEHLQEKESRITAARLNGSEFALLIPQRDRYHAEGVGRELVRHLQEVILDFDLLGVLKISIGICEYDASMSMATVLGCANAALAKATVIAEHAIVTADCREKNLNIFHGRQKWRSMISETMAKERLIPRYASIEDIVEKEEIFESVTFEMQTADVTLSFDDYLPFMVELNMIDKYMKYLHNYLLKHRIKAEALSFEMSIEPLKSSEGLVRFERDVSKMAEELGMPLYIEISEVEIYGLKPFVLENISETLRRSNIRLAIRRFNGSRGDYNHLRFAAPAYVRMDEHEFLQMHEISKNSLTSLLITLDIKLVIENVHADHIEELRRYGIRYIVL